MVYQVVNNSTSKEEKSYKRYHIGVRIKKNSILYFYTLLHKVMKYIEEPYEGNLQVWFCEGHSATPKY